MVENLEFLGAKKSDSSEFTSVRIKAFSSNIYENEKRQVIKAKEQIQTLNPVMNKYYQKLIFHVRNGEERSICCVTRLHLCV